MKKIDALKIQADRFCKIANMSPEDPKLFDRIFWLQNNLRKFGYEFGNQEALQEKMEIIGKRVHKGINEYLTSMNSEKIAVTGNYKLLFQKDKQIIELDDWSNGVIFALHSLLLHSNLQIIKCPGCSGFFTTTSSRKLTCSNTCKQRRHRSLMTAEQRDEENKKRRDQYKKEVLNGNNN